MRPKPIKYALLSGLLLCAAGVMTASAQNTFITFSVDESTNLANGTFNPPPGGTDGVYVRGTFDGWAYPGLQLVQVGSSSVYTNTVDDITTQDQSDGNVNFIYVDTENGGEAPGDYQNRMAYLPQGNNASLLLPTAYFNDIGPAASANVKFRVDMSEEIELGHFHPQSGDYVVVAGSFNGWSPTAGAQWVLTNDPTILVTNNNFTPPVVESNVYTVTAAVTLNARLPLAAPNGAQEYKFVELPEYGWDSPAYPNQDPDSGNRFFTEFNQTLPLVNFNDAPYAPNANVTLNVDMSGVVFSDPNYLPNSVILWGTFNNWATGVNMTNNPLAPNTNIYSTTVSMGEGVGVLCQVRYTNSVAGMVYDFANDEVFNNNSRRTFQLPITSTVVSTNLSTFSFNDLSVSDYLPTATPVLFSVDMNGAVGSDGHVFDPNSDGLYINGSFVNVGYPQNWYAWSGGINPLPAPPGYQMVRVGSTTVFTNTLMLPAGTPVPLSYQYGMDPGNENGGPLQDESSGVNHFRVVRSTASGKYVMPTDTFQTNAPYQEPYFDNANIWGVGSLAGGKLSIGGPVAGKVPVTWLGRPGAHLQGASSLNGPWTDYPNTDGTNWSGVVSTTNGLLSVTNWPSAGNKYFRLVKP
jgi:hypothetical protein